MYMHVENAYSLKVQHVMECIPSYMLSYTF